MDTVMKLDKWFRENGVDIKVIGVPKTIDNDVAETDHTPGFGSAAKYVAASLQEIIRDSRVYSIPSVTIVEIMGREAGWLAASSGAESVQSCYHCRFGGYQYRRRLFLRTYRRFRTQISFRRRQVPRKDCGRQHRLQGSIHRAKRYAEVQFPYSFPYGYNRSAGNRRSGSTRGCIGRKRSNDDIPPHKQQPLPGRDSYLIR